MHRSSFYTFFIFSFHTNEQPGFDTQLTADVAEKTFRGKLVGH